MDIREIKDMYSIKNVLSLYGFSVGRNNKINCLVHDDKNASMHVYDKKLKCFSCNWSGDIVDLCGVVHNIRDRKGMIERIHEDLGLSGKKQKKDVVSDLKRKRAVKEKQDELKRKQEHCLIKRYRYAYREKKLFAPREGETLNEIYMQACIITSRLEDILNELLEGTIGQDEGMGEHC